MPPSSLPPDFFQTPNRLGGTPVQENPNQVDYSITVARSFQQGGISQCPNEPVLVPVLQRPDHVNAELTEAKDAYQIAKQLDPLIGTRAEWIASLKGEPGETSIYDPVKTTLTGDGVTTVFTIGGAANIINPAAVTVAIDGADQEPGVDYTVAGGLITFTSPLEDGAKAVVIAVANIADTVGTTWQYLKDNWATEPVFNMSIAEGEVWDYPHEAATYYRLIPEPYVSSEDTFYAAFSLGVLTGPIVSRSQPI